MTTTDADPAFHSNTLEVSCTSQGHCINLPPWMTSPVTDGPNMLKTKISECTTIQLTFFKKTTTKNRVRLSNKS